MEGLRELLKSELDRRCYRNPQYSKRAFAKDLGISKSSLTDMLNNRRGLSQKSILNISTKLGLSQKDLSSLLSSDNRDLLEENQFSKMCHWWHYAIICLIDLDESNSNPKWISQKLDITESQAKDAIQTLCDLNIIEIKNKKMIRLTRSLKTNTDIPSRSLKIFHSENLVRADEALFSCSIEERELSSITAAINESQYQEIKKEAQIFREKISKILEKKKKPTRVYTMAIQIFPQSIINKET